MAVLTHEEHLFQGTVNNDSFHYFIFFENLIQTPANSFANQIN